MSASCGKQHLMVTSKVCSYRCAFAETFTKVSSMLASNGVRDGILITEFTTEKIYERAMPKGGML